MNAKKKEGHCIKNYSNSTAKAVREIPVKGCHRIILSGTFMQNRLSELWSLIDFISDGRILGDKKTFKHEFENRIDRANMKDATLIEKNLGQRLAILLKVLFSFIFSNYYCHSIDPYLLRRTKKGVKEQEQQRQIESLAETKEVNSSTTKQSKKALPSKQ
ncbi:hypothetical protein RFI_24171 [Reticulomyxa filosa]|uniref:SNF2 N-terminal domain-containing protein n=1 Tax=Reticulomyxa filosa TaxID=46433 RepID=X6MID6_RETFI|nr:hypothetical protein RFI_24171 [Reticulomyxa filosa]|eukprot:ETO13207.1 hypothetical protein RFI_24171 [Reticulomyxa filosa]